MEKQAVKVFISYARKDTELKDELAIQLKLLKMQGLVDVWNDREILPGQEWDKEIKGELEKAEIILLLISNDFLASDYINDVEVKKAFERYEKGEVIIIPVIIRPTQFVDFELSKFQALPKDAKPISLWDDRDSAWLYVATGLKRVILSLQKSKQERQSKLPDLSTNKTKESSNKSEIKGNGNIIIQDVQGGKINIIGQLSSPFDSEIATREMMSETVFADAQQAIGKGKTTKAIELLSEYMRINKIEAEYDDLLIQQSRLSNLERQKRRGTMSINEVSISMARINAAILSIISDLREEYQSVNSKG